MDWFKWLSRSNLEPSLVYQYGVLFSHNELQEEDIPFFNHEVLQSMGINIAKHRLEILKLLLLLSPPPPPLQPISIPPPASSSTKNNIQQPQQQFRVIPASNFSSKVLVAAVNKTKKSFSKYVLNSIWAKQQTNSSDKQQALAVVPVAMTDDYNRLKGHQAGSGSRGLTMLKRWRSSSKRRVQQEEHPKLLRLTNGGPVPVSLASTTTYKKSFQLF